MTANEYLENVLRAQQLKQGELDALTEHRSEVEALLREKFGSSPVIKYGGSRAKGTMIKESYDLDIVCYFLSDVEKTLKEIYEETRACLQKKYAIEPKASALRIKIVNAQGLTVDYHVDVIPGKFVVGSKDVFLYLSGTDKERIKTNIKTHIDYVSGSNYKDVIKLLKLWRTRNNLFIKTFVLELLVVELLKKNDSQLSLSGALKYLFKNIQDNIRSLKLVDPANSNNIISDILSDADKLLISNKAGDSVKLLDSQEYDEVEKWKIIFQYPSSIERTTEAPAIIINRQPVGSWCASK
jgi:hypothetical protein